MREDFDCLTVVLNTLSNDTIYTHDLEFEAGKNKNMKKEVFGWLQKKTKSSDFGNDSSDNLKALMAPNEQNKFSAAAPTNSYETFKHALDESSITKLKTRKDIVEMFDRVEEWNFDVFKLYELTDGHTLFITCYTLFMKYDFLNEFSIEEETLIECLKEIEVGYHSNPYHNSMHAADVCQIMSFVIFKGGLVRLLTKLDIMGSIIAAAVHDLDHPGLNNTFLVNTNSYLATLYNDRNVLENHHCAQAFEIFRAQQYNIFAGLSPAERDEIRETIIGMILATDMSEHANITAKFQTLVSEVSNETYQKKFTEKEDVRLALQIAIKFADISNASRPKELALKWANRIQEEFFIQGDKERELGLQISPFMDREKPDLPVLQNAFISYIILPMFDTFGQLLPDMTFAKQYLEENKKYWMEKGNLSQK